MSKVINEHGVTIDYDVAVSMMNYFLREYLHDTISPCTDQEFFNAYARLHYKFFKEDWELAKENPCY